jgi:integrase
MGTSTGTRVTLSDRWIASPARVPKQGAVEVHDTERRGLLCRISWTGHRSFLLLARFPPSKHPTRRSIGPYPEVTLEEARETALAWRRLIRQGIDPAQQAKAAQDAARAASEAAEAEAARREGTAFAAVCASYIDQHVCKRDQHGKHVGLARPIEVSAQVKFLASQIGDTPIAEVTARQCEAAILAVLKRAAANKGSKDGSGTARRHFQLLKQIFEWARKTPQYREQGLLANPMDLLDITKTAGKAGERERILTEDELCRVWQAASQMPGCYGQLIRLLILTGCRRDELAEMPFSEIDLDKRQIVIPAARMKMKQDHVIPLAPMAFQLVSLLPRYAGPYVFSANGGRSSFVGFAQAKQRLDKLSGVSDWVVHDLRRTMRSMLSALPIEETVREVMIAHWPTGLKGRYNRHMYVREKLAGYELYEQALYPIVYPTLAKLVASS